MRERETRAELDGLTLGQRLRRYRIEAGLTQEELAAQAGLSVRAVSDVERGVSRAPYPETVRRMATALDLDADVHATLDRARRRATARVSGDDQLPRGRVGVVGALPIPISSFVGRENELTELRTKMKTVRLLTLIGVGGVGKSRLALELAAALQPEFVNGVTLVELASMNESKLLTHVVADALGVREQPGQSMIDVLIESLRSRELLVVLDNCEHLVEACAQLATRVLRLCPSVRILATSREPLAMVGEVTWKVVGLSVPDIAPYWSLDELRKSEAITLFVQRGAAVSSEFQFTHHNAAAVVQICRRLDGMPLAIELAAAWLPVLTPEQIVERLDDALGLLTQRGRDRFGRHQSLVATLDWSYNLLEPNEQVLFDRLATFAGGWTLEAASSVCVGPGFPISEVLPRLAGLVDKSLVVAEPQATTMRYRLLEPVRQYGTAHLEQRNEIGQLHNRHRDWCLELAELSERELWTGHQLVWLDHLHTEIDNLRAALAWGTTDDADLEAGLRLGAALWRFWDMRGHLSEGRRWLETLLSRPHHGEAERERAMALRSLGYLATLQGDATNASAILSESEELWRKLGDRAGLAQVLLLKGMLVGWVRGELQAAASLLEESLALARTDGPAFVVYLALMRMSEVASDRSDFALAETLLTESLWLARQAGDRWGTAHALLCVGLLAIQQGDAQTAAEALLQSVELRRDLRDERGVVTSIEALAGLMADREPKRAAQLFGAAHSWRGTAGSPGFGPIGSLRERGVAAARYELGQTAFASAWAAGLSMSVEDAIACALQLVLPGAH
jgi:predicted ATPase/DNA-binding XRE family transcriptional regulator